MNQYLYLICSNNKEDCIIRLMSRSEQNNSSPHQPEDQEADENSSQIIIQRRSSSSSRSRSIRYIRHQSSSISSIDDSSDQRLQFLRIEREYSHERQLSFQSSQPTPAQNIQEDYQSQNDDLNVRRNFGAGRNFRRRRWGRSRSREKGLFRPSLSSIANGNNPYRCQFQYFQNERGQLAECLLTANYVSAKTLFTVLRENSNNLPNLRKIILHRLNFNKCERIQRNFQQISHFGRRRFRLHEIDYQNVQACPMPGLSGINVLNQFQFPQLRSLIIAFSPMDTDDIRQLIKEEPVDVQGQQVWNRKWPCLKNLNIENCKMNHLLMSQFCNNRWENLQQVNLSHNKLGHQGIVYLVKCNWPKLMLIELNYCAIPQAGAVALTKSNWPELRKIQLNGNKINQNGVKNLIEKNWWPKITQYSNFSERRRRNENDSLLSNIIFMYLSKSNWKKIKYSPYKPNQILHRQQISSDDDSSLSQRLNHRRRQVQNRVNQFQEQINLNDYQLGVPQLQTRRQDSPGREMKRFIDNKIKRVYIGTFISRLLISFFPKFIR